MEYEKELSLIGNSRCIVFGRELKEMLGIKNNKVKITLETGRMIIEAVAEDK